MADRSGSEEQRDSLRFLGPSIPEDERLERLATRTHDGARKWLSSYSREDLRDAALNAFAEVLSKRRRVPDPSAYSEAYWAKAADRAFIDELRRLERYHDVHRIGLPVPSDLADRSSWHLLLGRVRDRPLRRRLLTEGPDQRPRSHPSAEQVVSFRMVFERLVSGLTPSDLQLLDLLRSEYTLKEIAEQLGITHAAARKRRERLRRRAESILAELLDTE